MDERAAKHSFKKTRQKFPLSKKSAKKPNLCLTNFILRGILFDVRNAQRALQNNVFSCKMGD
jgi:hypothetical protein